MSKMVYPDIERYLELVTDDEYSKEPRLDVFVNGSDTYTARIADEDRTLLCVHGDRFIQANGDDIAEALANLNNVIAGTWNNG